MADAARAATTGAGWGEGGDGAALLESMYRLDLDDPAWLDAMWRAAEPLADGAAVLVASRNTWDPARGHFAIHVAASSNPGFGAQVQATAHRAEMPFLARVVSAGRCCTLRALFGDELDDMAISALLRETGFADLLSLSSVVRHDDGHLEGANLAIASPTPIVLDPRVLRTWDRFAAHLEASFRLRQSLPGATEAVLSPEGRVLHATGPAAAPRSRAALARAAASIDRARVRDRRTDIPALLDAWRSVYERRWTLMETVETDGRRLMLARVNPPAEHPTAGTSQRERQVAELLTRGVSQKAIAFELQVAPSTVSFHVRNLLRKLGVASVAELVVHLAGRSTR